MKNIKRYYKKETIPFTKPLLMAAIIIFSMSCEKYVAIDPPKTQLTADNVYTDDITANAAMAGVYIGMSSYSHYIRARSSSMPGLSGATADEYNYVSSQDEFLANEINPAGYYLGELWSGPYYDIYQVNAILEGLSKSTALSASMKDRLEGEARFLRALNYFYLINLFGDAPLILSTDYKQNALASRTPASEVYQQVLDDLQKAKALLPDDYSFSKGERVRANKWVATALLARVYLYLQNWANAEAEATAVINSGHFNLENNLDDVFLVNSKEAIWQILPEQPSSVTVEGFTARNNEFREFVSLSQYLLNAFEQNDSRVTNWIVSTGSYAYSYKYKETTKGLTDPWTEYSVLMRLAEQYLIRAEARAQSGNITGAQEDINMIRNRAGLSNTTAANLTDLMAAIEQERRVELFGEGGHRWLDLKRWNKADAVLSAIKPNWQPTDVLYPVPENDILRNVNLVQNPGY